MSGRSVAMASWQIMHVFTLGRPATGPLVTLSWQYSVQATPFSTCVLCGNGIGCVAAGRMLKKSRVAWASVGRAVVKTAAEGAAPSDGGEASPCGDGVPHATA